ncbi:MAG: type 1 glutamine amidotransferase [Paludibacter sp.]
MNKLSIHALFHVPFEGLGCIEQWIGKNGHDITFTNLYTDYQLPNPDSIDWLIVMGGPMGVYDELIFPWLIEEKEFIRQVISKGKTVIGICLGSQLIAEVLGAKVYPNKQKEIGWYDVKIANSAKKLSAFSEFESNFPAFHWHGDTYDLPKESKHLFSSDVCINQGFLVNDNVLGLQFHFEVTAQSLVQMLEYGADELIESETIQSAKRILEQKELIVSNNLKMFQILDYLENK